ncbi:class I tRNA ligase family protein [Candidatus Dojkabacteria bacterium]|nr:class I tRNA ligase family protein [Candidatus Dojkabacteria bacterium]
MGKTKSNNSDGEQYNHEMIEEAIRKDWASTGLYDTPEGVTKENKYYILPQLPYPSGSGLHVGHAEVYTSCDIFARFMRMKGKKVLQVMGWDAFGLPAENFAIKTNIHPRINTDKAIDNFREQISKMGVSVDWNREVGSHNPGYYKWTQWFFKLMYDQGLAYRKNQAVNWCESCKTVLANEQVVEGACERCDTEVIQKNMEQWFLEITKYADRLKEDLDKIDWPEETVKRQRDWIGKSKGANVNFKCKVQHLDLFFSTSNKAKVKRLKKILDKTDLKYTLYTADDLDIESLNIKEDGDLESNAKKKALAYFDKVNMPVVAVDTGLFIEDEHIDPVTVKRNALEGKKETELSQEEIGKLMNSYYKSIAAKHGGEVEAYFKDVFAFVFPGGRVQIAEIRRPIVITDKPKGELDIYMPIRNLYKTKATGKYVIEYGDKGFDLEFEEYFKVFKDVFSYNLEVFTTRPDTLYGATFMVIAPEHELIERLGSTIQNYKEVKKYVEQARLKSELERQQQEKEKTGVRIRGIYAINPVTKERIPIFVADYVLITYGTGSIMGVPAHDERDFEFALKYDLSIIPVIDFEKDEYICFIKKEWRKNYQDFLKEAEKLGTKFLKKGKNKSLLSIKSNDLKNFIKLVRDTSQDGSWLDLVGKEYIVVWEDGEVEYVKRFINEKDVFDRQKDTEPDVREFNNVWEMLFNSTEYKDYVCYSGRGKIINSEDWNGWKYPDDFDKVLDYIEEKGIGKRNTIFKLRDWSVSRQRFWGAPIPMLIKELKNEDSVELNEVYKSSPEKVVQMHAWDSDPQAHFHSWVEKKLEKKGIKCVTPQLPKPVKPNFNEWVQTGADLLYENSENSILVGRSLSVWSALKVAEKKKLRKLILLCPTLNIDSWYKRIEDVVDKKDVAESIINFVKNNKINFEAVERNVGEVVFFLSTDDPYIPLSETEEYIQKIFPCARIRRFRESGHFDAESGYNTFPELIEEIEKSVRLDLKKVKQEDLPVLLPDDVDFKPTGQSPLTYSDSFQEDVEKIYGKGWRREVDTLDTFMCSSWYYYRYLDPNNDEAFASKESLKKWMPVDFYIGGPEHVNGHLLYSRFFTKVLYDAGYIDFDEPFKFHRHQGMILGEDNRKMSKRWGNVVNPTDVVNKYGADTLRVYEMFMGPLEQTKAWSDSAVRGVRRFLQRVYDYSQKVIDNESNSNEEEIKVRIDQLIKKISEDTKELKFNTAIAEFMKFMNFAEDNKVDIGTWKKFMLVLAPYAPFITEYIWKKLLGNKDSIHLEEWPQYDEKLLSSQKITIAVQVMGKTRGEILIDPEEKKEDAVNIAENHENVSKYLKDGYKKAIYVKGKIINFVI